MAESTKIANAYVQIIPSAEGISGKLENLLSDDAEKAGKSSGEKSGKGFLSSLGKVVAAGAAAALAGVTAFAADAVKVGDGFDSSMSQVAATMGVTVDEILDLRDFAQEMGAATSFSASQAADALNYMALAGYDAETSMKMLPNVLNLAAAGGIDLAAASDMVTDASSALGLSLDETAIMVDQMARASSKSNTSVAQLGEAMLAIGGTAKSLRGGTTELSTALGILADNGIKGAEGGTHLRNILLSLQSPTDTAADLLKDLGVSVYDAEGNMRDLESVFGELNAAMEDMTSAEKTNIVGTLFNKTDLSAVNALLSTSTERWEELSAAIAESAGAAQTMADTQLDNLAGDVTLFQSALEGAKIAISDVLTPTLREFVQFGSESVSTLATAFKEEGLGGAMSALGTILSDGLSMVMDMVPSLIEAGAGLLGALVEGVIGNLSQMVESAGMVILSLANGLSSNLPELIPTIIEVALQIVDTLTDPNTLGLLVDASIAIILALASGLIDATPRLLEKAPVIVSNLVTSIVQNAPKLLSAALEIIVSLASGLIEYLPEMGKVAGEIIGTVVTGIMDLWHALFEVGGNIVAGIYEGISAKWDWFKENVSGFFSGIVDGVKNTLGIHSPSRVFADQIGKFIPMGIAQGIEDNASYVKDAMEDLSGLTVDSYGADVRAGVVSTSRGLARSTMAQDTNGTDLLGALLSGLQAASGTPVVIEFKLSDGTLLQVERVMLPGLINIARAAGTPIVNPT